ncbi:hypothetical protein [Methylobacterium goesingense]|uniref:Uncharacterized protein n=1 Tax=Methylobacterium goesingense TaxID=243690 RepID=A0ABV2LB22_9HYPH|nr:hypothetical protein [Methylobacterium goesingense]GJD76069.1 hypothetical protein CFIICLFH_4319 [Methylobacterium goesingense]
MTDPEPAPDAIPGDRLSAMNAALAEWAACSAAESPSLIERFEAMGYRVRGKSREEVAEVLKHPPAGPSTPPADGR